MFLGPDRFDLDSFLFELDDKDVLAQVSVRNLLQKLFKVKNVLELNLFRGHWFLASSQRQIVDPSGDLVEAPLQLSDVLQISRIQLSQVVSEEKHLAVGFLVKKRLEDSLLAQKTEKLKKGCLIELRVRLDHFEQGFSQTTPGTIGVEEGPF